MNYPRMTGASESVPPVSSMGASSSAYPRPYSNQAYLATAPPSYSHFPYSGGACGTGPGYYPPATDPSPYSRGTYDTGRRYCPPTATPSPYNTGMSGIGRGFFPTTTNPPSYSRGAYGSEQGHYPLTTPHIDDTISERHRKRSPLFPPRDVEPTSQPPKTVEGNIGSGRGTIPEGKVGNSIGRRTNLTSNDNKGIGEISIPNSGIGRGRGRGRAMTPEQVPRRYPRGYRNLLLSPHTRRMSKWPSPEKITVVLASPALAWSILPRLPVLQARHHAKNHAPSPPNTLDVLYYAEDVNCTATSETHRRSSKT